MVTVKDIARDAGVSPMTVSNVINNRPNVRSSTRERVLQSMNNLDYRVNVAARSLRTGRTHTIGLAVPEVDTPYYGQLGAAVIQHGARHDFQVAIEQTGRSLENELNALAMSRLRMYDGLILSTVGIGQRDVDLLKVDFPIVILGERIFQGPVDHIGMPNVDGSDAAVQHLIDRGCRRIMIVQGARSAERDVSNLRETGYRRALKRNSIPVDESLILTISVMTPRKASTSIHEAITHGVTFDGIFCVTDHIATGVLRALFECGIQVPHDVKVIGFDDLDSSQFLVPSLSSVNPDHDLIAQKAVDLLMDRIAGTSGDPIEFTSPFRVVARESTSDSF